MRKLALGIAAASLIAAPAQAQQLDLTGKWSLSGLIVGSGSAMSWAQICDLTQTGAQFAGPCHGPNGGCSAVGVINGASVDFTCQLTNPGNPGLNGVLTLHGAFGVDQMVRGTATHTRAPGLRGQFAMMRI